MSEHTHLPEQNGRRLSAGELVFEQGDPSDHAFLLQAGRIELSRETAGADRVFRTVEPGEVFGTSALLNVPIRTATARCTLSGAALALNPLTFQETLEREPKIAARLFRQALVRMHAAETHVDTLLLGADGDKVLSVLAAAAASNTLSADGTFNLPPGSLATDTGLDISVVRQYVAALRGDGYLSIKDERISVTDVNRLLHLRDGLAQDANR